MVKKQRKIRKPKKNREETTQMLKKRENTIAKPMKMWKKDREHPPTQKKNAKQKEQINSAPIPKPVIKLLANVLFFNLSYVENDDLTFIS